MDDKIKIIAKNKRAGFDFHIHDKVEAGMLLRGTEVKSLRDGKVSLNEAYVEIDGNGEAWISNLTIGHYTFGNVNNHDEVRKRKLLMNKKEILDWYHMVRSSSYTIIPTQIYFKGSIVKIELALARGKKIHDKRDAEKTRDIQNKLRREEYE